MSLIRCKYCGEIVPKSKYKQHLSECPIYNKPELRNIIDKYNHNIDHTSDSTYYIGNSPKDSKFNIENKLMNKNIHRINLKKIPKISELIFDKYCQLIDVQPINIPNGYDYLVITVKIFNTLYTFKTTSHSLYMSLVGFANNKHKIENGNCVVVRFYTEKYGWNTAYKCQWDEIPMYEMEEIHQKQNRKIYDRLLEINQIIYSAWIRFQNGDFGNISKPRAVGHLEAIINEANKIYDFIGNEMYQDIYEQFINLKLLFEK
jgi:hypothetical protein